MYAGSFAGALLSNVPCKTVEDLRIRVIATLMWLLVAEQIFTQILLGDFEFLHSFVFRALDDRVMVALRDPLSCFDVNLQT